MKRIVVTILATVTAFTLTACGDRQTNFDADSSKNTFSYNMKYSAMASNSSLIDEDTVSTQESEPSSSKESSSNNSSSNFSSSHHVFSSDIPVIAAPATMEQLVGELNNWNLVLVNRQNPLPKGYTVATTKIKSNYARDNGMLYDSRAVAYLNAMCAAAKKDGVSLLVISSFRTNARQTTLYNNQVAKQKKKYPDKSDEEIRQIAGTISAFPGTSEHELGMAVDFNSVEENFENTAQFAWLKEHAAEYGFIMRYPKEKQSITGVIYEPWHYRYVGVGHAKKIKEQGMVLEEYKEYLKNYKE